jgi:hypothetical protein
MRTVLFLVGYRRARRDHLAAYYGSREATNESQHNRCRVWAIVVSVPFLTVSLLTQTPLRDFSLLLHRRQDQLVVVSRFRGQIKTSYE